MNFDKIENMSSTELWLYAESLNHQGEFEQSAKLMEKAAQMGEILANDSLARYYENGIGVNRDYIKAAELYEKVAISDEPGVFEGWPKAPHCAAAYALGRLYEEGLLPNSSAEQSFKWYELSAKLGEANANFKLAEFYLKGCGGIEQNYKQAFSYLLKGYHANMSFDEAKLFYLCNNLLGKLEEYEADILRIIGDCYMNGWGCEKSESKAEEYYSKANKLRTEEFLCYVDDWDDEPF